MSIREDGIEAEQAARLFLTSHHLQIFQADWIARDKEGCYCIYEVKHLEPFDPPPFWGHGLSKRQIYDRLNFQDATGVVAILLVLDKSDGNWYHQRLDILNSKEYHDTKNGIRIYPRSNFIKEAPDA